MKLIACYSGDFTNQKTQKVYSHFYTVPFAEQITVPKDRLPADILPGIDYVLDCDAIKWQDTAFLGYKFVGKYREASR